MGVEIWVAIITSIASLTGVIITVNHNDKKSAARAKEQTDLTLYRIGELEKKQDEHNNVIKRVYELEKEKAVFEEELKVANKRIKDLEQYHK